MATLTFGGRVLPERANVSISHPLRFQASAMEAAIDFEARVTIQCSQITAVVETPGEVADLPTLRNYLEDLVRAEVDALNYLWGRAYEVEITTATAEDGRAVVFGVGIPELERTQDQRPVPLQDVVDAVFKSQHLRRALGNLREAIRSSIDTGFFCYRAVESIRQSFWRGEDGENPSPSWERLRSNLRVSRSCIDPLKRFADPQRHGLTPYMSSTDRVDAMLRAWKIVDRFCVFVSRGSTALPEPEFEMLDSPRL